MDLQDHLGFHFLFYAFLMNSCHCQFYHFRCRALNWHIDGHPFRSLAPETIIAVRIPDGPAAPQNGFYIFFCSCFFQCGINIGANAAVLIKIGFNYHCSFGSGDIQFLTHTERPSSIHDTKIHYFCNASHFRQNTINRHTKNITSRTSMYIFPILKGGT